MFSTMHLIVMKICAPHCKVHKQHNIHRKHVHFDVVVCIRVFICLSIAFFCTVTASQKQATVSRSGRLVKPPEQFHEPPEEKAIPSAKKKPKQPKLQKNDSFTPFSPGFSFVDDSFTHQPVQHLPPPKRNSSKAASSSGIRQQSARKRILPIEESADVYTQGWRVGDERVIAHCMSVGNNVLALDIPGIGMKRVVKRESPIDVHSSFQYVGAVAWWRCDAMGLWHDVAVWPVNSQPPTHAGPGPIIASQKRKRKNTPKQYGSDRFIGQKVRKRFAGDWYDGIVARKEFVERDGVGEKEFYIRLIDTKIDENTFLGINNSF